MTLMAILLVLTCTGTQKAQYFVEKMEKRFQKRRVLTSLSTMFFVEELTQIEWSISKKQYIGIAYERKK